jgi:hypothetical protein
VRQRGRRTERGALQKPTAIHDSPFDRLDERRHAATLRGGGP